MPHVYPADLCCSEKEPIGVLLGNALSEIPTRLRHLTAAVAPVALLVAY